MTFTNRANLERTAALSVPDDDDSIDGSNSIPPTPPSQTALTTIPKTPGPPFFPLVHSNACEVESESAQGITPPHPPAAASPICVWSPLDRVYACPVFAHAALMGSVLGMCVCVDRHVIECPPLASFIATSPHASWRWVGWIVLLLSAVIFLLTLFLTLFQPKTYAP
ncbi:hypothetical protein IWX47DRAFT_316369 [Phyllosticta citricarpa]